MYESKSKRSNIIKTKKGGSLFISPPKGSDFPELKSMTEQEKLKRFKNFDKNTRIGLVIHDGQWYTLDKWAKQSRTSLSEVKQWLHNYKDNIIVEKESYRVNVEDIINWYNENNLDIKEEYIPGNFPPRIFDNITETQALIDCKRLPISKLTMSFTTESNKKEILRAVTNLGKIVRSKDEIILYCLSGEDVLNIIKNKLSKETFNTIKPKIRNNYYYRDVSRLSDTYIEESIEFYLKYIQSIINPSLSTIKTFFKDYDDRKSQYIQWYIDALNKYDESQPVPFSAYLASAVRFWPYNIPVEIYGRELAGFKKHYSKAVEQAKQENANDEPTNEEIYKYLSDKYTEEEYKRLLEQNENIVQIETAGDYYYGESAEPKLSYSLSKNNRDIIDLETKYNFSVKLLEAGLMSKDYDSTLFLVSQLGLDYLDNELISNKTSNKYKEALWQLIREEY